MSAQRPIPTSSTVIMRRYIVIIQTPTTRLVFRSDTTCGSPTTTILESRVAMKIPTVVTVRTTHLYSKRNRHTTSSIFRENQKNRNINSGRKTPNSQPDIPATIFRTYHSRSENSPHPGRDDQGYQQYLKSLGEIRLECTLISNSSTRFLERYLLR